MSTKLGIQFERGSRWLIPTFEAGSRIVKVLSNAPLARQLARENPRLTILERRVESWFDVNTESASKPPAVAAHEYMERTFRPEDGGQARGYVEGPNEPHPNTPQAMAWYGEFEAERANRLDRLGFGCALGGFSTGTPQLGVGMWAAFAPALRACAILPRCVLHLHEYGNYKCRPAQDTWNRLRYRRAYAEMRQEGLPQPKLVVSEAGLDSVDWVEIVDGVAFVHRGFPFRNCPDFSRYDYLRDLALYDVELQQDEWVIGATLFGCNLAGDWGPFDMESDDEFGKGFCDWMRSQESDSQPVPLDDRLLSMTIKLRRTR